jgi:uncharacterized protein with beta-barrel porin domain
MVVQAALVALASRSRRAPAFTNSQTVAGGSGGTGGNGNSGGAGSDGGAGGSGGAAINIGGFGGNGGGGGTGGTGGTGANGGNGGAGVAFANGGTLINQKTIAGGVGGAGGIGGIGGSGGTGGIGGAGGAAPGGIGGSGGIGGNGGNGGNGGTGGNGGNGGAGVAFANGGTLINQGTITGGNGGTVGAGGGPSIGGLAGGGGVAGIAAGGTDGSSGANGTAGNFGSVGASGAGGPGGVGVTGANLTIVSSGTISGGLAGDGVTRADAILFTGGSNRLQLQPGYNVIGNVVGTGSDAFQLGGSGSSNFNLSSFGSTQQYQGFATFSVVGGNWTLTGTNATAVPFSVSNATATISGIFNDSSATVNAGGMLIVNGTLSDPTINSGGTLTGTGTVGATQVNTGGAFAPGNGTPGSSTTVAGNLAFQSGALYVVYLNATTSSFANVTGTATLAGSVNANFATGSYMAKQYVILKSAGISGTFSGTAGPPGFDVSLSYNAADVLLNLVAQIGATGGLNPNQQNVANTINNFFNNGGALPANFLSAFGANPGSTLSQLDGEDATDAEHSAFDLMNGFLRLLLDPSSYGGGTGGGSALGFAPEQGASVPPDLAFAYARLLKAQPQQTFAQRWSGWGAGFGGSGTVNGAPSVGSNNVTTSTYGYAAGMDYHYSPDTVLGFALAGGGTHWNLANALGTGRSDAFLAGIHGVTHVGSAYVAAALAFANNWFTTNRTALGDQLTANFRGQSYAARLEGGYRYAMAPAAGVTPYAAVQAQNFHTPTYSETDLTGGGLGLTYNAMNGTDTRSELGARFDDLTALGNLPLILRARLAWAHDWVSNPALNASFESLPGTAFTVSGAPIPHDSALTSASALFFFTPNWSLTAKFDGEFASGSQLYAGSGTLRYTW